MNLSGRGSFRKKDSLMSTFTNSCLGRIIITFSEADTTKTTDVMDEFNKYNRMEYYDHVVFSTIRLSNNYRIEGVRCAIGIFGMVIPTANYSDFLLRVGPVRKDYNQPIIPQTGDEEYFGENPDLGGVFRYEGE